MRVGFIGLGIMGRPMCKNLLKAGYAVTAFDPFAKEALDDVVSCGAARGESNADVASKSDVVITMVPNSPHVRAAVLGKGGVAEGAHEGLDVIDMSSTIGDGTKISHLTYVGDSDVGKNINFGCGTVTVNYDRVHKSRTVIDDNAFIGCNTNLIAPVHVGEGAYIAAGSTVTDDVPPAALAIARARQQNKRDWANRHKLKEK